MPAQWMKTKTMKRVMIQTTTMMALANMHHGPMAQINSGTPEPWMKTKTVRRVMIQM